MSLFGSLMGDVEDDPFFGSHMRTMRQMNNMMNSLFSDPFGMMGGGPLAIGGPRHHGSAMMPFMPQMPSFDRLFSGPMEGLGASSSFSSSTVVMSNGPGGKPQIYSSSSSTKVGPNGVKETRKTLQDSRTGTKKMSIGHHIGERAHVIEREQNVYSGEAEESQEFINIDEEEAEDFDREFQVKAGQSLSQRASRAAAILPAPARHSEQLLALPPAPSTATSGVLTVNPITLSPPPARLPSRSSPHLANTNISDTSGAGSVRDTYSGSHPQRHRHKHHKAHRHSDN